MRRQAGIRVASMAMLAAAVAQPVQATCWEPEEYEAARMRDLQTMLMVSALKCGRAMPEMPMAYNRWVGRAKPELLEGEKKLLAHFLREGDKLRYDKFTTALANRYSELAEDARFCARTKALLEADEQRNGVLAAVVAVLNAKPNGVGDVCPAKPLRSVIVVSPFDPIPTEASAVAAQAAAPAPPESASAPPVQTVDAGTPDR